VIEAKLQVYVMSSHVGGVVLQAVNEGLRRHFSDADPMDCSEQRVPGTRKRHFITN